MKQQNNETEIISEVLNNIAHQWRQPLGELSGILMEIETASKFDNLEKEYLSKALKDANILIEHMSQTIDDFSNFFKPDKKMETFCVNDSIEFVLFIISNTAQNSGVTIVQNLKDTVNISGFKREFEQVLLNIFLNAIENFQLKNIANPQIKISLKFDANMVLEVSDNGGGIENDISHRIFEPYFSTKKTKKNSGIGLYMAKMLIEKSMSGKLEFENSSSGALFRIIF